jgi:hypothetical protein
MGKLALWLDRNPVIRVILGLAALALLVVLPCSWGLALALALAAVAGFCLGSGTTFIKLPDWLRGFLAQRRSNRILIELEVLAILILLDTLFWLPIALVFLIDAIRLVADWVETRKFKRGLRDLQCIIDAN